MWSVPALCGWPVACVWAWILLDWNLTVVERKPTSLPLSSLPQQGLGILWERNNQFLNCIGTRDASWVCPLHHANLLWPAFLTCHEVLHFQMEHSETHLSRDEEASIIKTLRAYYFSSPGASLSRLLFWKEWSPNMILPLLVGASWLSDCAKARSWGAGRSWRRSSGGHGALAIWDTGAMKRQEVF